MSSTNKTPNFNLNQWIGSDRPKRTDFNHDNNVLDSVCGGHINNSHIHITQDERDFWTTQVYHDLYFGDGSPEKKIYLGYKPKAVLVYSHDVPLGHVSNETYSGMATEYAATLGIKITDDGFKTYDGAEFQVNNIIPRFNKPDYDYGYIVFKGK